MYYISHDPHIWTKKKQFISIQTSPSVSENFQNIYLFPKQYNKLLKNIFVSHCCIVSLSATIIRILTVIRKPK